MNSSSDEEPVYSNVQPTRMTSEIEQLLGKANQHFIFQEFDEAIEILHDIITKAPGISDPYHVLALIYEEKKEHEKAVNFFMLAAQVTQHDSDLWAKVAHMHKELGHYKEAIYCYSRALLNRKQPEVELMKEKAVCYERLEQYRKAGKIYSKILKISSSCDPNIAKALVEVFTIMKQPRNAIKELKEILDEKHDDNIVNLICDLQIQLQEFSLCIDLLENLQKDSIPLEIEVKKGYCLARLGRLAEADACFEKLMKHSVRYYDDLFLLVGSLYMDLDQHENSLRFFEPLLALPQHNKPSLWFKCGKLYYDIKDFKSAEEAFKSVIETFEAGLVTQAKLYLSKIYKAKGEIDKSILILKTKNLDFEDTCEISDEAIQNLMSNARLKIEESFIKKDQNELLTFMDNLIDTEFKLELRKREDIVIELGVKVLNEVFEKLITFCIGTSQYSAAKSFLVKILKLNMYKGNLRMNMKKLLSKVCVLDKDYEQALNAFKFVCENEESESNWIVMSSLMRKTEKPQLRSWLCKIAAKSPENYAAHILLGNSYFQTGNYNLAIKQYMQVYSVKDSVVNLQLGLSHLFSLCSRNLVKKEEVFAKAFKYMKIYVKARKNACYLEAYYNLARAYHHIQFYAKASYNYEKVLRHCARAAIYGDGLGKSVVKYSKLAAKNLVAIRNTIDDPVGAENITQQWLSETP